MGVQPIMAEDALNQKEIAGHIAPAAESHESRCSVYFLFYWVQIPTQPIGVRHISDRSSCLT